jgi:redox-regulated HSP33 family molecular chaperone
MHLFHDPENIRINLGSRIARRHCRDWPSVQLVGSFSIDVHHHIPDDDSGEIGVTCHWCNKTFTVDREDFREP